jgi:hypothetical protein
MKKILVFLLIVFLAGCGGLQRQLDKDIEMATESATKWSDYGDMGSGTIADNDSFLLRDVSDESLGATGTQKEYIWADVKTDLSSFDAFEFPNANDTTSVADVQAEAGHDNDDFGLAIHDDTNVRYYAMRTKCLTPVVIVEPDEVQDISDDVPLYNAVAEGYPGGFVIEAIHIWTDIECTDAIDFREFTNNGTEWTDANQIEAITLSGVFTEDDGTLAQNTIAADASLFVDLVGTCDVAWMMIQICIQIPVNN